MYKQKVLVVDDDPAILRLLRNALRPAGFEVEVAESGEAAVDMLRRGQYDLLLIDIVMGGITGLELVQLIRQWSDVCIIVISGRGDDLLRVRCLDAGADDFIAKPLGLEELRARVRAVLRRIGGLRREIGTDGVVQVGDLRIDMPRREVALAGKRVHLTPTEYKLLCALAGHPGRVLTHQSLLHEVWGPQYSHEVTYLRNYVRQIRRKLARGGAAQQYIHTEPGVGYRFCDVPVPATDADLR